MSSGMKPGDVIMRFGKFVGRSIDSIAGSDEGLRYLDWLAGQSWLAHNYRNALKAYLGDPAVAGDMQRLLESKEDE